MCFSIFIRSSLIPTQQASKKIGVRVGTVDVTVGRERVIHVSASPVRHLFTISCSFLFFPSFHHHRRHLISLYDCLEVGIYKYMALLGLFQTQLASRTYVITMPFSLFPHIFALLICNNDNDNDNDYS
jgi:hypothetical protein